MSYQSDEEERRALRCKFKDVVDLEEAATICLIEESKLLQYAKDGFAPHVLVDRERYYFRRKEIFDWAKENLVEFVPGQKIARTILIRDHKAADIISIPENLIPIYRSLRSASDDGFGPCVYFLIKNREVVYIGQSRSLASRIESHKTTKDFNDVLYLPCPNEGLNELEGSLIRKFNPKYNVTHVGCEFTDQHRDSLLRIGFGELA